MKRAHKIRIYPNNRQRTLLEKSCGCARLAYNVCLAKWNQDYQSGIKHSYYSIKKWFNGIKQEKYPFICEVSKWAPEAAIADLNGAFKKFFAKHNDRPTFHKKGIRDSFRIDGSVVKINGNMLYLPKGLCLRMAEPLRYEPTKIYNVTVSKTADRWFVSIQCEVPESENQVEGMVGIDLGVSQHAALSDGTVFENIKLERKYRRRLARAQRNLHRKQKGSNNRRKARKRLATVYWRMANKRSDNIHKFTTAVTATYATVCLEDLNVAGMVKNHNLEKAISDVAFGEARRQFEYKDKEMRVVGRFEPTTKLCCECGRLHDMPLNKRRMACECGNNKDRDHNAAINILRLAK
jgi:putative transposase